MKPKIKSKKWYGRFWPPERRKIKLLQAILDSKMPEIEPILKEGIKNGLLYGIPFGMTEDEANKWTRGKKA